MEIPAYKTLQFLEMMIDMYGMNCEECGDNPSFPDKWYFLPTPEAMGTAVVCPTCLSKRGE